jgi:hypothetical protein
MKRSEAITIMESGLARCVAEPRAANGLESYGLGQSHRFERCQGATRRFCRVYPDGSFPDYYETCGEIVFASYFEPIEVQEGAKKGSSK